MSFLSRLFSTVSANSAAPATVPSAPCADLGRQTVEKRIVRPGGQIYCAVGYGLSNIAMIAVDGGKIIIDAGESVQVAAEVKAEFDRLAPGPVKLIIYTHSHADHILGASVFHEPGVPIWAHENLYSEIRLQMGVLSRTLRQRASKQFGDCLPPDQASPTGLGPALRLDRHRVPPILFPTHTFRDSARLTVGGLTLELEEAPGETRDHLFLHLPELKAVFPGDNVYRAFPNLYAIRGSSPRPVRQWSESIDKIRWLEPELVVPGHTDPIQGRDQIQEILTAYRDAIAFLNASVVRLTNEGRTPDEMVQLIRLPEHLRSHPYLQETYGKLPWAVRGIYEGYLGWFDGNPTKLQPLAPHESAARMVELAGGAARVENAVCQALERGEGQWAAELCDLLLALRGHDRRVTQWKAAALEQLADRDHNPVARNYYRSSAGELRGTCQPHRRPPLGIDTLRDVPIDLFMQSLPLRLRPERTADLTMRIGFDFPDSGRRYTLYIRRGIGEIRPGLLDQPDFVITASEAAFKALASGALPGPRAALSGAIRSSGGWTKLRFLRSILYPP